MQVKISYTAEIVDVPKEVANILRTLEDDSAKLNSLIQTSKINLLELDLNAAKSDMNLVKEKMQRMFARLTDCQVILTGYEDVVNQKTTGQDKPVQE
jgi:hypothetical protein